MITTKLVSLIFLAIASFIELPNILPENTSLFGVALSVSIYKVFICCAVLFLLFFFSILIVGYYSKRYTKITDESKTLSTYDIVEIFAFIFLDTTIILLSGKSLSPYKIIFIFIMISATIQYGVKYGLIVSLLCSAIVLAIDLVTVPAKPNPYLQIDLLLCGVYIMTTWLLGYYRDMERQYSLKMANLAITDDLTGLYSHGYFQKILSEKVKEAQENNKPISLLFIDIDYFKYFNDLFGHQRGDEVLRMIGDKLKNYSNPLYYCARYGGEEFTIVMSETTEDEAVIFAEKLRKEIELEFTDKFEGINKITVSIGVSCLPTKANDKEELIKYADDALYRAKSFHRNRVETYQSVLEDLKNDIEDDDVEIISSLKTLISIINSRDKYTYRHAERVVIYCSVIADALNLSSYDKKTLKYAAYLHDIGKINIPPYVLNKKMPLTDEEWNLLKQHPAFGVDIITPVKSLADVIPIILHHHERFDGSGYPDSLKGEEIPYLARILTVADSFDAMTTNRPYASFAKNLDEGIEELIACSSTHFDPDIAQAFVNIMRCKNHLE